MGLSFPGIGRLSKSNPFPRSSSRINMSDAAIAATPDDEEKKLNTLAAKLLRGAIGGEAPCFLSLRRFTGRREGVEHVS